MPDEHELYRTLEADEIEGLGPMPADDGVSPTTARDGSAPGLTAEVHFAGTVRSSSVAADDDPFPPPPSLSAQEG